MMGEEPKHQELSKLSLRSPYRFLLEEEYYQLPLRDVGYAGILKSFINKTSSHGIPHVNQSRGIIKVTFWVLFTLGMITWLTFTGKDLIIMFIQNDVKVKVTMKTAPVLPFPAVTVCNHNAIRSSQLFKSQEISQLIDELKNFKAGIANGTASQFGSKTSGKRKVDVGFEFGQRVQEILANMYLSEKSELGHESQNLILECKYNGWECSDQDFDQFYDSKYGNCFVFNWGKNGFPIEQSNTPGARHGLSIIFNLEQSEYMPELTEEAGLRVVVHPQDNMPFPGDQGISVSPGQISFVGVRKLSVDRIANCTMITSNNYTNVYEEWYNVRYTSKACRNTCFQLALMENCDCGDSNYPMMGKAFGTKEYEPCSTFDEEQADCVSIVEDLQKDDMLNCNCPEPCYEENYQSSVSTARWPSDKYKAQLHRKLGNLYPRLLGIINNKDASLPERNFGKLDVYFEQFNFQTIKESPAYTLIQLISDFGGILGLFIGFSMLTIGEFVELLFDLSIYTCIKCCCGNKKSKHGSKISHQDKPLPDHYTGVLHGYDSKQEIMSTVARSLPPGPDLT